MKVLAVMGSPRRGKSYQVTRMLEEKLRERGDVEFEYVFLKDVHLEPCRGCHACITPGEDACPLTDERAALVERMLAADGIILVSPVYSQQVTALMKGFLDRLSYLWHRPRFFGKKMLAVATGGGMFKETLGYLEQCARAWGFEPVHRLGVPHLDALTPKFHAKVMKDIDQAADVFYRALSDKRLPRPRLWDLIWFRMWRLTTWSTRDSNPCDYAYWRGKGWYTQNYYYREGISPLKNAVAALVERLMKRGLRSMYQGY